MSQQEKEQFSGETVVLEFFSKDDGSDQFTLELAREDFERYELIAANLGVPIEDLMVQLAEAQVYERNTQWLVPSVAEDGTISFEAGMPVDLNDVQAMAAQGKGN